MYSRAVRVLRALFRLEGWRAQGTPAPAPAVYVVHHQNMAGPIRAVAHLPLEGHIWALEVFCNAKTCFAQYYGYTFTKRFGMPKPLAFVCAKLVSGAVSGIVRGCGAIPVYRGRREIVETMRLSQQVLEKGENIILCPDVDYSSSAAEKHGCQEIKADRPSALRTACPLRGRRRRWRCACARPSPRCARSPNFRRKKSKTVENGKILCYY
mgnify:CR=1 FL=1